MPSPPLPDESGLLGEPRRSGGRAWARLPSCGPCCEQPGPLTRPGVPSPRGLPSSIPPGEAVCRRLEATSSSRSRSRGSLSCSVRRPSPTRPKAIGRTSARSDPLSAGPCRGSGSTSSVPSAGWPPRWSPLRRVSAPRCRRLRSCDRFWLVSGPVLSANGEGSAHTLATGTSDAGASGSSVAGSTRLRGPCPGVPRSPLAGAVRGRHGSRARGVWNRSSLPSSEASRSGSAKLLALSDRVVGCASPTARVVVAALANRCSSRRFAPTLLAPATASRLPARAGGWMDPLRDRGGRPGEVGSGRRRPSVCARGCRERDRRPGGTLNPG